jgi:NAD(P)-dependent dehydrogenase (short-subunit alcohol dehydrogenase family)
MEQGKTALIIGASRGLGAGLTWELATRGWTVVATQRRPSAELQQLAGDLGTVGIETVDIDDRASVDALTGRLAGQSFDLVLVNAGVAGPDHSSAEHVTTQEIAALMMTNAISPIVTARKVLPLVKEGGTVAFLSSILGSVGGRTHGGYELYSASKAALNSLTRGFAAKDVGDRDVSVVNLHPGWVRTDMGGPEPDIDVATSVAGLADVLEDKAGAGHRYIDYQGHDLIW